MQKNIFKCNFQNSLNNEKGVKESMKDTKNVHVFPVRMPGEIAEVIAELARLKREQTLRSCTRNDIILDIIERTLPELCQELGLKGGPKPCLR